MAARFTSYKDLTSVKWHPLRFGSKTTLKGSRDEVWAHLLLSYVCRTPLHDRDAECFSFVLPLLSLFTQAPPIQ